MEKSKISLFYLLVAGMFGFLLLGPGGAVLGGLTGLVYGVAQANGRRIVKLEREVEELKNDK